MRSLQVPPPGAPPGEWWTKMEPVFSLERAEDVPAAANPRTGADGSAMTDLTQAWPRPSHPHPIAIIGAGAIVRTAHLPVYRRLGYPVAGVYDVNRAAAQQTAAMFDVDRVFHSLEEACAADGLVYDLAVPGDQILDILTKLPAGSGVLMQKPMGRDLDEARRICQIAHDRGLVAAVNLQLRFSPNMLALGDLIAMGCSGPSSTSTSGSSSISRGTTGRFSKVPRVSRCRITRSTTSTPSGRSRASREGVYCRAVPHPELPRLRDTRSSIILDYGDRIRCSLVLNHTHRAGPRYRESRDAGRRHARGRAADDGSSTCRTRPVPPTRWRSLPTRRGAGAAPRFVVH